MTARPPDPDAGPEARVRIGPLAVPTVVAGVIPALLAAVPGPALPGSAAARVAVGVPLALVGGTLVADAVNRVYLRQPTPLGDRPPQHLVTRGGYRIVRNPMTIGMVLLLAGEAVLYAAPAILAWGAVVLTVSVVTTRRIEEPSLAGAFGDRYLTYAAATAGWIPFRRGRPGVPPTGGGV